MGRLALIGGRGFEAVLPAPAPGAERAGPAANLIDDGEVAVLARHGIDAYVPPHLIDHAANICALLDRGCDRALAICSVGALRDGLAVGSFLCPDDFIDLGADATAFDDERGHVVPGF